MPKGVKRFPAFAKLASAGEGRSDNIMLKLKKSALKLCLARGAQLGKVVAGVM